jgi:hypothetical protein
MKPIPFKEQNVTYGEGQPEYYPLPVHKKEDGQVTSCWKLSWPERIKIFFTGRLYLSCLTFNKRLQPVSLSLNKGDFVE